MTGVIIIASVSFFIGGFCTGWVAGRFGEIVRNFNKAIKMHKEVQP